MIGYSHTVFSIDASISILYIPSHVLFLQCDTDRIYQEVGSVFPSSQPHQAFVTAAANRMCHRWHCVICTAGHKRQYGFCLALLLSFQPWNQDSTLWGSLSFMEKPHKTGLWLIISIRQYESKQTFMSFQPLIIQLRAQKWTWSRDKPSPLCPQKTMSDD